MANKFYVWRRNDGHVDVTTSMPRDYTAANGNEVSFKLIKEFDAWANDVVDFIIQERNTTMITYAHKDDPQGTRYRQFAKDPVPPWAVDVQPEEVDAQPKEDE